MINKDEILVSIIISKSQIIISYDGMKLTKSLSDFKENVTKEEIKEWFIKEFNL